MSHERVIREILESQCYMEVCLITKFIKTISFTVQNILHNRDILINDIVTQAKINNILLVNCIIDGQHDITEEIAMVSI